jgi:hypothetical protein
VSKKSSSKKRASRKRRTLNVTKAFDFVYDGRNLREFLQEKTFKQLVDYTVLGVSPANKKILLQLIMEKLRSMDEDEKPNHAIIVFLLSRRMVLDNKELVDDLVFNLNHRYNKFLDTKSFQEIANYTLANHTVLEKYLEEPNKKILLDKMSHKFMFRKGMVDTEKIRSILKLPMVSSNESKEAKELKGELTRYAEWAGGPSARGAAARGSPPPIPVALLSRRGSRSRSRSRNR